MVTARTFPEDRAMVNRTLLPLLLTVITFLLFSGVSSSGTKPVSS
jgi:hypothetical protein